jgi:hypothetical protein
MPDNLPPEPKGVSLPPPGGLADPTKVKSVKFFHEKTPDYRIIHVDGAWGSISSIGNAQLDLYVESAVTPNAVLQPLGADGNLTGEQIPLGRVEPETILVIRNIQCSVVLSLAAAMQVHAVLDSYISSSKKQLESAAEQFKKTP